VAASAADAVASLAAAEALAAAAFASEAAALESEAAEVAASLAAPGAAWSLDLLQAASAIAANRDATRRDFFMITSFMVKGKATARVLPVFVRETDRDRQLAGR
jgi:hypothetical protein